MTDDAKHNTEQIGEMRDDHETRLRALEHSVTVLEAQTSQLRWLIPVLLSVSALIAGLIVSAR